MNPINHGLITYLLVRMLELGSEEVIAFVLLGAFAMDLDVLVRAAIKGKFTKHLRTWYQEPFSLLLIWLPVSIALHFVNPTYSFALMITADAHIAADYLTIHEVRPLSPFSDWTVWIGFIEAFPVLAWRENPSKFSELYITFFLLIVLAI